MSDLLTRLQQSPDSPALRRELEQLLDAMASGQHGALAPDVLAWLHAHRTTRADLAALVGLVLHEAGELEGLALQQRLIAALVDDDEPALQARVAPHFTGTTATAAYEALSDRLIFEDVSDADDWYGVHFLGSAIQQACARRDAATS